jgi:predicted acyltransferase
MKETVATFGFILFFVGAMMDIAGSTFVTQGGTPAAVYFRVGVIELIGSLVFLVGIYLIVKTR